MKEKIYKNCWIVSQILGTLVLSTTWGPLAPAWADSAPVENRRERPQVERPVDSAVSSGTNHLQPPSVPNSIAFLGQSALQNQSPATSGFSQIGDAIRLATYRGVGSPSQGLTRNDVMGVNQRILSQDFNGVRTSSGFILDWERLAKNISNRTVGTRPSLSNQDTDRILGSLGLSARPAAAPLQSASSSRSDVITNDPFTNGDSTKKARGF